MAGIYRSRKAKAMVSLIMTVVMVLSLFAGIGVFWKTEKVGEAYAVDTAVADAAGKYVIPEAANGKALGTEENPFVVLEIVPGFNLAQFGYLVGGQEPVKLDKVNNADFMNVGGVSNRYSAFSSWVDKVDCELPLYMEFLDVAAALEGHFKRTGGDNSFRYSGVEYDKDDYSWTYKDQTYYPDDFLYDSDTLNAKYKGESVVRDTVNDPYWKDMSETASQYGYYTPDENGDYKLVYVTTPAGYEFVKEDSVGDTGEDIRGLTTEKKNQISMTELVGLLGSRVKVSATDSETHIAPDNSRDFVLAPNGDLYVSVGEGAGVYSFSYVYKKVGDLAGEYSLKYKFAGAGSGDYEYVPAEAVLGDPDSGWKEVGAGYGRYVKLPSGTTRPEYVGSMTYTSEGSEVTVKLGEYKELTAEQYCIEKHISTDPVGTNHDGNPEMLPVYVDETGLNYIGSKDYDRYVVKPQHKFEIQDYNEGDTGFIGRYRWEGLSYEDSISLSAASQDDYNGYLDKKGLQLVTTYTYNNDLKAKAESGNAPFDKIKVRRDGQTIYGAYVKELKNRELFKSASLGLAHIDNDVTKDFDTTGYKFLGWYTDKYGVNPFSSPSEGFVEDVTLYAKWLPEFAGRSYEDYIYSIAFDGGSPNTKNLPATIDGIYGGSKIIEPDNIPIYDGKLFTGWYLDSACTLPFNYDKTIEQNIAEASDAGVGIIFTVITGESKRFSLYAGWKDLDDVVDRDHNPVRFTIKFDNNRNSLGRYKKNYKVVESTMPGTITDIAINGWVAEKQPELDALNNPVLDGEGNIVYRQDGLGHYIYEYRDVKPMLSNPVILTSEDDESDLVFGGWYLDSAGTERFDFDNPTQTLTTYYSNDLYSITLYARWIKKNNIDRPEYTVTFNTNEPSEGIIKAKNTATGLEVYTGASSNTLIVKHGSRLTYTRKGKIRTVNRINDIRLNLEGNAESRIEDYVVKVITITPNELRNASAEREKNNYKLIDRANLIVINQSMDAADESTLKALFADASFRNSLLFPNTTSSATKFTDKISGKYYDLSWEATKRIWAKVAGLAEDGSKACPLVYDYSIYESVVNSTDNSIMKTFDFERKYSDGDGKRNNASITGYNYNVYKLFLATQKASPTTLYKAYVKAESGSGNIDTSGKFTSTASIKTQNDNTKKYWNEDSLIPWNLISKAEALGNIDEALATIGFVNESGIPSITAGSDDIIKTYGNSRIKNRVLVYNYRTDGTGNSGVVKEFSTDILRRTSEMDDVFGTLAPGAVVYLDAGEVLYYMLKDEKVLSTFDHDLRILDIEPGSVGKDKTFWFWYISRYVPNYTGTNQTRVMSTAEFNVNIDDLNSEYDVIYFGTNTLMQKYKDNMDPNGTGRNVTENLPSIGGNITGANTSFWIKAEGEADERQLAAKYKLINVIPGITISKDYYQVTEIVEDGHISDVELIDISSVPRDGYTERTISNLIYSDSGQDGKVLMRLDKIGSAIPELGWTSAGDIATHWNLMVEKLTGEASQAYKVFSNNKYGQAEISWYGDEGLRYGFIDYSGIKLELKESGKILPLNQSPTSASTGIYYTGYNESTKKWGGFYEVAFDLTFYYKVGQQTHDLYKVIRHPAGSTVDFTGQVLVENGSNLPSSQLIYSHVGKLNTDTNTSQKSLGTTALGTFNSRNSDGTIKENDDYTTKVVLSGNDISFQKYTAISEFLKAGYPVILGRSLFTSTASDDINSNIVDSASWIYKLLSELTSKAPGEDHYYWYREDSAAQDASFTKSLSNKTFRLKIDEDDAGNEIKPVEYVDKLQYPSYTEDMIYVNGAHYKQGDAGYDDHQYDNINNKVLSYQITIDSKDARGRYRLKMLIDANADGRYDEESELLDAVSIEDLTTRERGTAAGMELRSGHSYKVERSVPFHTGIIPWKLLVTALDEDGNETGVRDAETGMSAIKVKDKEVLYVLQITSDMDSYHSKGQYTSRKANWVYFPTDREIEAEKASRGLITNYSDKQNYFEASKVNFQWENSEEIHNASWFHYYTSILEEYEVHFLRVPVDFKKGSTTDRFGYDCTLKEIAATPNTVIGQVYEKKNGTYQWVDKRWSDINMIILGYTDCYNDISDRASLDLLKQFIDAGKTILFTHDTISYMSYGTAGTEAGSADFGSDTDSVSDSASGGAWKAIRENNNKHYWGYNISKYYRDPLGLDRYGALVNRGLLNDGGNPSITGIGELFWNALGNTGDYKTASRSDVKDFVDINLSNASEHDLEYDIPFQPGTTMDLYNDAGWAVNTNLANTNKDVRTSGKNHSIDADDNRILVHGFIDKVATNDGNHETTGVTRTNTGQIVTYPFTIGQESNKFRIKVAQTHTQYYQLNIEDEEIVVWYSIYQSDNRWQGLLNDGSNNYYIYNKGNVTYSGVGHSGVLEQDEYKLFVNTMIAAYQSAVKATKPVVKNGDRSAAADKDFIYVDFDASVNVTVSPGGITDPDVIDAMIKEKLDEADPIVIGKDVGQETVDIGGESITYYTKRVRFTLENNSIVMNKVMTVHYYPVVYHKEYVFDDDGNPVMDPLNPAVQKTLMRRVVLYDNPIPLVTKNVKTDVTVSTDESAPWEPGKILRNGTITAGAGEGKTASEIESEGIDVAFAYSIPLGKTDDSFVADSVDNYEVIGVPTGQEVVESLEEYYVDVPITDNYYQKVLGLGDEYYYYPTLAGYTESVKLRDDGHGGTYVESLDDAVAAGHIIKLDGSGGVDSDYDSQHFAINTQSEFEIEIQVVMRYGRDQSEYVPKVGTRGVVFMRRGMFTLD